MGINSKGVHDINSDLTDDSSQKQISMALNEPMIFWSDEQRISLTRFKHKKRKLYYMCIAFVDGTR